MVAFVASPDGRFIKVNRSLCELTGYAEMSLLVRSFQAITHPDDLELVQGELARQIGQGQRPATLWASAEGA